MPAQNTTGVDPSIATEVIQGIRANKALVRRFLTEGMTSDDMLLYAELLTTDHVQSGPAPYQKFVGIDGCLGYFAGLLTAFPDLEIGVTSIQGMGNYVHAIGTMRGRHTGEFVLGDSAFAPTEREASWEYTVGCRVEDGKIAETKISMKKASLMRQLGISFSS